MLVGLTGGIASGKSTAAGFLKECGAIIIDVDEISRDMVKPGMPGLQRIESCFGDEIITSEGSLDRDKLGSIVFASEAKRELLNKVLHPFIIDEMHHRIAAVTAYGNIVVADVPLLIECGMQKDFDKIIVVYCDRALQKKRLMLRNGLSSVEAENRLAAQISLDAKRALADYVIPNIGTRKVLQLESERVYGLIEQGAVKK